LVPIVGYNVKAELSIGRVSDTVAVHLCQGSAEFLHIRQLFDHIDVVAKAEVHVGVRLVGAGSYWAGDEIWGDAM
jgi:hypothetical protein